jgi:hypothetical protein
MRSHVNVIDGKGSDGNSKNKKGDKWLKMDQ